MVTTTQICPRCLGTGKHSYNPLDGDVCYGCNGAKTVPVTTKGKKVKATAPIHKAVAGDIIELNTFYRVEDVRWIEYTLVGDNYLTQKEYNQRLKLTRLTDGKECFQKRRVCDGNGLAIHTPSELIGTLVA